MKARALTVVAILLFATIGACGRDDPMPTGGGGGVNGPPVTGTYTATQWTTSDQNGSTDQLAAGSTLTITLNANGSTTGHLHAVASSGNPSLDKDMTGAWSLTGGTVHFAQNADTFVRDMPFVLVANGDKWLLQGDQTFSQVRVELTLTQS